MGFEGRSFPSLLAPCCGTYGRGEGLGGSSSSDSGGGDSSNGGSGESTRGGSGGASGWTVAHQFTEWARSEGLPLLGNQWSDQAQSWDPAASGVLLQECHAAHQSEWTADDHARVMIDVYTEWGRDVLGLPLIAGAAPPWRALPGAAATYTAVALLPGGRAAEAAAAHAMADHLSRAVGASLDGGDDSSGGRDGGGDGGEYLHEMGAGVTGGALRAAALVHGDNAGLRLPPAVAPVQVQLIPIVKGGARCDRAALAAAAEALRAALEAEGVRVAVDDRPCSPGVKFGSAERRGVPVRIEFDPEAVAAGTVSLARRDAPGEREAGVPMSEAAARASEILSEMQSEVAWRADVAVASEVVDVASYLELQAAIEAGKWARGPWAGGPEEAAAIQEETGAALVCIPLAQPNSMYNSFTTCLYTGYQATQVAVFARLG